MSSKTQHQQTQSSTDQTVDTRTCSTEQDAVGNQQRGAAAGLQSDADTDYDLTGDFAGIILDGMPLTTALTEARAVLSNPAVVDWVLGLDPVEVAEEIDTVALGILDRAWPRGLGVTQKGILGGALGFGFDFEGAYEVKRDASGALVAAATGKVGFSVGAGKGPEITDANGGLAAGGSLAAKGEAALDFGGQISVALGVADLLKVLDLVDPRYLLCVLNGQSLAPMRLPSAEKLAEVAAIDPVDLEGKAGIELGAKVEARAGIQDLERLPIAAPAMALLDENSDLVGFFASLGASYAVRLERFGLHGLTATVSGTAHGMARALDDSIGPEFGIDPAWANALEGVARAGIGVRVDVVLTGDQVEGQPVNDFYVQLTRTSETDGLTTKDKLRFDTVQDLLAVGLASLDERVDALADLDPGRRVALSTLLGQGNGFSLQREVRLALDLDALDRTLPGFLVDLVEMASDRVLTGASKAELIGEVNIGEAAIQVAAAAGLTVPAGLSRAVVLLDLATAICAARLGQPLPAAYQGQEVALQAAACQVKGLENARIEGILAVSNGGGVSAKAVIEGGASLGGTAGLTVNQAVEGEELQALERAASGRIRA